MTFCVFLGFFALLLYPAFILVLGIVRDFDKTSKSPSRTEGATYWEWSLDISKRDLPMVIFGYLFAFGLLALALYLTFFSCAFSAEG